MESVHAFEEKLIKAFQRSFEKVNKMSFDAVSTNKFLIALSSHEETEDAVYIELYMMGLWAKVLDEFNLAFYQRC